MNTPRKTLQALFLAASLGALSAAPAFAEPGCGPMGGHGRDHGERHMQRMETHHSQLREALKLTPEQEPAWKKFSESRPMAMPRDGKSEDWSKLKAPERAEKMLEASKDRQSRMAEHVNALKSFYAGLSAEQQKTFDEFRPYNQRGMRGKPATQPTAKP